MSPRPSVSAELARDADLTRITRTQRQLWIAAMPRARRHAAEHAERAGLFSPGRGQWASDAGAAVVRELVAMLGLDGAPQRTAVTKWQRSKQTRKKDTR